MKSIIVYCMHKVKNYRDPLTSHFFMRTQLQGLKRQIMAAGKFFREKKGSGDQNVVIYCASKTFEWIPGESIRS